ncbi:MAG: sugar phosphate nucleotidyltransferase [Brevinema sp.]
MIKMNDILGIILAGGQGTRLEPLTSQRSKPAVPFGGRYRIIDFPITNCINSGIGRIFVLTQFHSASLNQHITQTYKFDLFHNSFVDIIASGVSKDKESSGFSQGTADAVRKGMHHIKSIREATYGLILAGDQLYRMNFNTLTTIHDKFDADLTLGVVPVPRALANAFGIVKVNEQYQILDFWEKPGDAVLDPDWYVPKTIRERYNISEDCVFTSMSIYLFKLSFLDQILKENIDMMDFGKEIIPHIIQNHQVQVAVHNSYWEDIGTLANFHKANLDLTYESNGFELYDPSWPTLTRPSLLPPTSIKDCTIIDSIISDGSRFEKCKIKNCVIGQRAIIQEGSKIENSVIMGADWIEVEKDFIDNKAKNIPNIGIGKNCTISNAIIDKNSRIGNNVTLINKENLNDIYEDNYIIRDNLIIIPAKAVIPDNFTI